MELIEIGIINSELTDKKKAPKQGDEGDITAEIEIYENFLEGLNGIDVGSKIDILTWLHKADRRYLSVHPRGDESRPKRGVFLTRSPDRPNPIGVHHVTVLEIKGNKLKVHPIETLDKTPIIDIKKTILSSQGQ